MWLLWYQKTHDEDNVTETNFVGLYASEEEAEAAKDFADRVNDEDEFYIDFVGLLGDVEILEEEGEGDE